MLKNYSITLKYRLGDEKKPIVSSEIENDDYTIIRDVEEDNRLVLSLEAKDGKALTIEEFSVVYRYDFMPRFKQFRKIFINGYQSWTDTKEYTPNEHTPVFENSLKTFMKIFGAIESNGLENSGDYKFAKYSKKPGNFHSFSYMYLRDNADIELFGSMNEASGYTIFYVDVAAKALTVTKELEGITVSEKREVINIARYNGEYNATFDKWFSDMNIPQPRMKHVTGYTSWYNYYTRISEDIIVRDLDSLASSGEKIDIFQIDDGYQTTVGDWLSLKPVFPSGMKYITEKIHSNGMKAGLWLAPFGATPKSEVFKTHKDDWFVKDGKGKLVKAGANWGGFYTLDIYNEEVREHLRNVFDTVLNEWDFDMVKLDFLYQVAVIPYNGKTRGEIMTDAMDLLREICGDKLILGCGVPLYPAFGKVDFCRVGADVDLSWNESYTNKRMHRERVSTKNTLNNTIFRRHLDGRAFVNDPDVFLLRDKNIRMKPSERKLVATINRLFGNLLFTSDNVADYSDWQKELLHEIFSDYTSEIVSAEYVTTDILHIKYKLNSIPHTLTIDMNKGTLIERNTDEEDIATKTLDDKLETKSDEGFVAFINPEDDNDEDFEFDNTDTTTENAESDAETADDSEEETK